MNNTLGRGSAATRGLAQSARARKKKKRFIQRQSNLPKTKGIGDLKIFAAYLFSLFP
jgi:hypothetical protein